MKVAIIHEFLNTLGGAEQVLKSILKIYPEATVYTLMYKPAIIKELGIKRIHASSLNNWPNFIKNRSKFLLPFMPMMIESFDLNEYDLVISSSNSFAHGVITRPECLHVCYYHSPMRFVWDSYFSYFKEQKLNKLVGFVVKKILHNIRKWDQVASFRPDIRIANSKTVAYRINKYYRQAVDGVIFPPVEIPEEINCSKDDFALVVSRLSPYKKIDQAILACNEAGIKLKVAGTGADLKRLKSIASNNVEFLGRISDKQKWELMQKARLFLFPGIDDFGITAVEAMACNTPVIAFNEGGATETVINQKTGILYQPQTVSDLAQAITEALKNYKQFESKQLRRHAKKFSEQHFISEFKKIINDSLPKI